MARSLSLWHTRTFTYSLHEVLSVRCHFCFELNVWCTAARKNEREVEGDKGEVKAEASDTCTTGEEIHARDTWSVKKN